MFSEKLENLIKASLQDGLLTEQEKRAILKRAEAEGEDPNEVDIYIQSLLQKSLQNRRKIEDEKDEQRAQIKKKEMGRVCPNCGRQVPPLTLKCECGYEFTSSEARKTAVQELLDNISQIKGENRDQRIRDIITLFPIPNTKEDIIDFLSLSAPNIKKKGGLLGSTGGRILVLFLACLVLAVVLIIAVPSFDGKLGLVLGLPGGIFAFVSMIFGVLESSEGSSSPDETLRWNRNAVVWKSKFDQVLMKGRSLRGDPEFQRQLDYYEGVVNKK